MWREMRMGLEMGIEGAGRVEKTRKRGGFNNCEMDAKYALLCLGWFGRTWLGCGLVRLGRFLSVCASIVMCIFYRCLESISYCMYVPVLFIMTITY